MKWWKKIWNWSRFWTSAEKKPARSARIEGPVEVFITMRGTPHEGTKLAQEYLGIFPSQDAGNIAAQAHVARMVIRTGMHGAASVGYQAVRWQKKEETP